MFIRGYEGLYINYFKRYDKYYDTHEPIFNTYEQYILSGFRPKIFLSKIFIEQNTLNLSKKLLFEISFN